MTSRERVLTALEYKTTDRVPFSLGMGVNRPVRVELMRELGFESMDRIDDYLDSLTDIKSVRPRYIGPKDLDFTDGDGVHNDIWGVGRSAVYYRPDDHYMEICKYPLAGIEEAGELDDYRWPSADWFDFSCLRKQINELNGNGNEYAIMMGNGNIFESSWYMRGFERMLTDLILDPELACAIMDRVTDFYIDYISAALETTNKDGGAPIDLFFTADDIGGQDGLLFSLDLWERLIKPRHKRMNKIIHDYGAKVIYHSDGAIMEALDGLIDMGVDVLEALQFDAKGMSPEIMKNKHGGRLCFHGGISVQSTLPHGTPSDVRAEIADRIRVLGRGGGYILAPSHAIQAGTPVENALEFLRYLL